MQEKFTHRSIEAALVVSPKHACELLDCGNTHLYDLLARREIVGLKDGKSRKIVVSSIQDYIRRRIAEANGS